MALEPPRGRQPWRASFGDFRLCSKKSGQDITLESVRYDTAPAPKSAVVFVRRMTREERLDPPKDVSASTFYSAYGSPPDFSEPYATLTPGGSFSRQVAGTPVTEECASHGKGQLEGFTELVFAVVVGREGTLLRGFRLDYTSNGKPYAIKIAWTVVGCGTRVREYCRVPD